MPVVQETFYMYVYAKSKGYVESVCVIRARPIKATCYNQAYSKAMRIMQDNSFDFENIFLVIEKLPY